MPVGLLQGWMPLGPSMLVGLLQGWRRPSMPVELLQGGMPPL